MPVSVYVDVLKHKTDGEFPDALWRRASEILTLKERVRNGELSDWTPQEAEGLAKSKH